MMTIAGMKAGVKVGVKVGVLGHAFWLEFRAHLQARVINV